MQVNLDYLKFHSFKYNKKYTNELSKDNQKKLKEKFIGLFIKEIKHINKIDNIKTFLNQKNSHWIEDEKAYKLIDIINKEHPNLMNSINQWTEKKTKLSKNNKSYQFHNFFVQFHLEKGIPVFCIYDNDEKRIIPIIIDFNHCFYKQKNKKNNYKYNKAWKSWNFKKNQENIKKNLYNL